MQGFLANAVFEKARQFLPELLRQKTQTIVGTREPRHGLLIAADECWADLIVIGARGVGHLKQPSLGSIAQYVVHHATTPVLVVRGTNSSPAKPVRVLLASDGSAISRHALEILERLTWPSATRGHAITVLESSAEGQLPDWLADRLDDQQLASLGLGPFTRDEVEEARVRQETTRWYGPLPAIFRGRDPLVVAGHVGEQILKAIDAQGIDLVVVGARRQGAIRRLLLGSTSELVFSHAPCSVLIVRERQQS